MGYLLFLLIAKGTQESFWARYFYADGKIYEGQIVCNSPYGQGIFTDLQKPKTEGQWDSSECVNQFPLSADFLKRMREKFEENMNTTYKQITPFKLKNVSISN